jgi:putative transposase
VKIRDDAVVRNKAIYLALAVLPDGTREVLGIWIEQTEGAKFWLKVFNELRSRGVNDILIAVVDGLKGPGRSDRDCVPANDGADAHRAPDPKQPGLRELEGPQGHCLSTTADLHGCDRPGRSRGTGGVRHQPLGREVSENVIPFFAFPPEVRRVIYTTNVIESLHMQLRKIIKNRGHFPNDNAAIKLLWLALRNITDGKVRSAREWKLAMNQFAALYGDRFVSHVN